MKARGGISLSLAAGLAVALVWPWGDITGHAHWDKIGWVPFVSPPVRPLDILANLLLFIPTGIASGIGFRRPVVVAASVAILLSIAMETAQIFSHTRFPSSTDVVCNVIGAILAAHAAAEGNRTNE